MVQEGQQLFQLVVAGQMGKANLQTVGGTGQIHRLEHVGTFAPTLASQTCRQELRV